VNSGTTSTAAVGALGWRFPVGVGIFVAGFVSPAAIPLVTSSDLPTGWKTLLSGFLAVGLPELMMLAATAIMGKEGFAELKRRLGRFMKLHGPPDVVGPTRYRVGLVIGARAKFPGTITDNDKGRTP